jgi:hypothetical protein
MALAADILRRINRDFNDPATIAQAIRRLEEARAAAPDLFSERVLRCAVFAAAGDLETLDRALALARIDPRDLIVWAEYDNDFANRRRDLTRHFR